MKYTYIIYMLMTLCFYASAQQKLNIVPLKMLNKILVDTNNNTRLIHKFDFYLIKGYKTDKKSINYIDDFAQRNKDKSFKKYSEYHMMFYKESATTNVAKIKENIKPNGDYLDNADDFVFDYNWLDNGRSFERHELDNGKEVHEPKGGYAKMSIVPLKMLNTIDTLKDQDKAASINKFDYYLIKGYADNSANSDYINRFVEENKDPNLIRYNGYHIIFYMETDETNLKSIEKYVKTKDKYYRNESDLVYDYQWYEGKFLVRNKYHHGWVIEPKSRVTIKDIPIPKDSL